MRDKIIINGKFAFKKQEANQFKTKTSERQHRKFGQRNRSVEFGRAKTKKAVCSSGHISSINRWIVLMFGYIALITCLY